MKKLAIFALVLLAIITIVPVVQAYGSLSLSQTNINLGVGQTQVVYATPPAGQIVNLVSATNTNIATASLSGNNITVFGITNGTAQMTFCTFDNSCNTLFVNVGSIIVGGGISFSQSSVNLNLNQSAQVFIYTTTNPINNSFYITSNTNPNAVSASISGSTLNLYALNSGTSNVMVCQTNGQCGTIFVSVNSNNTGNLFFSTTSLPQLNVNQYYSYQLQVSGGNAPYNFILNSGSLPSGLSLTNQGLLYGVTPYTGNYSFTARVTDNFGRTIISPTLTLSTGSVLGATLYNNGTLINDNGTIYITYKNTKSAFANSFAFTGLGYKFSNVIYASSQNVNFSGFVISNPNVAHPWGSWIKNGSTIYFVHDSGLIPIASMDVFTGNGGVWASVVNANSYDFNKPIQALMMPNDQRLK